MNNLEDFLKKFKTLIGTKSLEAEIISKEISACLGMEIPKEKILVKGSVVSVSAAPALKSQIFMKKQQILGAFKKYPELKNIFDVR